MNNIEILKKHLVVEEGVKNESYLEPISGKWHIAIGHLLDVQQSEEELQVMGLDDELEDWEGFQLAGDQCYELLDIDIQDAIDSLAPKFSEDELMSLAPARFISIIAMSFQVGGYGVQRKFPSFCEAVKGKDWQRAADEMMWSNGLKKQRRSAWHKQTATRCEEAADMMLTGVIIGEELVPPNKELSDTPSKQMDLETYSDGQVLDDLARRLGL